MSVEFLILPTPVTRMPDVWIILVRLPVFARLGLRMLVANVQVSYSLFQMMWQLFRVVAFWHSTFQYAELLHCTFLRHIYSRTVVDKRPFHIVLTLEPDCCPIILPTVMTGRLCDSWYIYVAQILELDWIFASADILAIPKAWLPPSNPKVAGISSTHKHAIEHYNIGVPDTKMGN